MTPIYDKMQPIGCIFRFHPSRQKQASLIALDLDKSLTFRKEKRLFFIVHLIEILLYF